MGRLTTHVLDTASGRPAAGLKIELYSLGAEPRHLKTIATNSDGRADGPILEAALSQPASMSFAFMPATICVRWA